MVSAAFKYVPQITATTFAFISVFDLLLSSARLAACSPLHAWSLSQWLDLELANLIALYECMPNKALIADMCLPDLHIFSSKSTQYTTHLVLRKSEE